MPTLVADPSKPKCSWPACRGWPASRSWPPDEVAPSTLLQAALSLASLDALLCPVPWTEKWPTLGFFARRLTV